MYYALVFVFETNKKTKLIKLKKKFFYRNLLLIDLKNNFFYTIIF